MSDQTPAPEDNGGPPTESGPPEWLSGIETRMDELANQQYEIAQQFQGFYDNQPVYADPEEETSDEALPEDQWYDDEGELTPQAAEQIIDQRVNERLSEQLGLRDAAAQIQSRDDAYEDLIEAHPELEDEGPEIVAELVRELTEAGRPEVIDNPVFVDLVEARFKAGLYDKRSNGEAPSDEVEPRRGVMLEAAGGGSPQRGRDEQEDWQARVVEAMQAQQPRI